MNSNEKSILTAKICGMALISSVSVIVGLLPMFVHARFKRKKHESEVRTRQESEYKYLVSHLSAFGGGVLLSTTFLHLLPEIRESIEDLQHKKIIDYSRVLPLGELLMCCGFLFLYLLEEIAHKIVSKIRRQQDKNNTASRFPNGVYNGTSTESTFNATLPEDSIALHINELPVSGKTNNNERSLQEDNSAKQKMTIVAENGDKNFLSDGQKINEVSVHSDDSMIFFTEGSGKNFLLISALSVHEGFEGLAIGLASKPEAIWYMILGVGAHKAVIAFCIGVQMLSTKLHRKVAVTYLLVFATATPLGVAIGLFLSTGGGIFCIVLQGLATGTLLHVVFFELLKPHSVNSPFSGVFIGFIIMAVLKYVICIEVPTDL